MSSRTTMFPFSPKGIHALPVELLTRIFVLGAEDDDPYKLSPFLLKPDQHYYAIPSTLFQLTASHVCHHWRHVALRTPALWTTLFFREHSHILRAVAYLARCSRSPSRRLDILVDTVAPKDHIPGVTLCRDELIQIFDLICPHVPFWRAFHLKIRDDGCKQIARKYLGNAPPAPNLETLQLYHFEDFRVAQDLYIATYRRPVRIFSNSLPRLRNVSLIGVNLPWDQSPYLHNLHMLELALHSDHTRPPYVWWDRMLRFSPHLQRLLLHYSGPRAENGTEDLAWTTHDYNYYDSDYHYPPSPGTVASPPHDSYSPPQRNDHHSPVDDPGTNRKGKAKLDDQVLLDSLWELSLTDLDPDYLCRVLQRLVMPNVNKLSLDLPDQDFTPFVELIVTPPPPPSSLSSYDLGIVGNGEDEGVDPAVIGENGRDESAQPPISKSHRSDSWNTFGRDAARLRHFGSGFAFEKGSEDEGEDDMSEADCSGSATSSSASNASSTSTFSAQSPMFQIISKSTPPPSTTNMTTATTNMTTATTMSPSPVPASSASRTSMSMSVPSTSINSAFASMFPAPEMSKATTTMLPSNSIKALRRNANTDTISVNSIPFSGSTPYHKQKQPSTTIDASGSSTAASGSSTITTITSSTSSIQAINNSSTTTFAAKRWPLPRISATLHTLIITALECDFTAWKALFWSLEGVSVLEVNFEKISLTCDGEKVKCAGRMACGVLLDLVLIHAQKGPKGRNVRMVLPRLGKCRIEGLGGRDVKCLVQGREALALGRVQEIEWTVVEDKFAQDQIMSEILEKGVWVSSRVDDGGGGGECGRWVKVLKVVEDEEDEVEEDEEDEAGEDEVDVEQEDGEDEADEAVEEEEANDVELDSSTVSAAVAAEGEDIQQVIAEQYAYYLDARSTTSNTRAPITSSHTTAKSRVTSSSGSSSSTLTSISSSSTSSSSASSMTIKANRGGARRTDGHRGME